MKRLIALVTLLILTIIVITGCGVSQDKYNAAVNTVSDLNVQLSNLQIDLTTTQADLAATQADLAATREDLVTNQAELATSQQNLNTVLDDRDAIQKQLEETEADLATAQDQLEAVDPLINTLQTQNNHLQEIIDLSLYSAEADAITVHQISGQSNKIASFTAEYAGYIVVSGTSTTADGDIYIIDSYDGYPFDYYRHYFGTGRNLKIPVLPGTISVYFTNTDPAGAAATITVIYYY